MPRAPIGCFYSQFAFALISKSYLAKANCSQLIFLGNTNNKVFNYVNILITMKAKSKKLKLKPSARDKRRYFIVNSNSNEKIEKAILEYLGVLGFAKSAYMKVKSKSGRVVGSCLREELNNVRAALGFKGMKIEKVSGTLKGLGV